MAMLARGAPVPALVEEPQFQAIVRRSSTLINKILFNIPATHKSCIYLPGLQLNSSANSNLETMATNIGMPSAPVVKAVSEDFPLETCLRNISEGLQLHWALLTSVSPRLGNNEEVPELQSDIRDLVVQISKLLELVQKEAALQLTPSPVTLNLSGDFEVQVATHLTLDQLQSFGQDVARFLRSLDRSDGEETES